MSAEIPRFNAGSPTPQGSLKLSSASKRSPSKLKIPVPGTSSGNALQPGAPAFARNQTWFAKFFRFACFVAIFLGLCAGSYLCLRPNSNLRGIPWLPSSLERWADYHGRIRNFPAFAVLAVPFMVVCNGRRARRKAILGLSAFVTGTELAQHFIPGRWCEWQDVLSGCAGLVTTWLIFEFSFWGAWRLRCMIKRRKEAKSTSSPTRGKEAASVSRTLSQSMRK